MTLPLGVIRLSDRSGGDPLVARIMVDADFDTVPWIAPLPGETEGRDLYLVGGAWRALARVHMAQTAYPLNIVHHYVIGPDAARDLAQMIATAGRRALERTPGVGRRRIDDLPMAAVVLRRLLRSVLPRRVVFSANGLREGWFLSQVDAAVRAEDPLLAAGRDYAHFLGRDPALPPLLVPWTDPIFAGDTTEARRLRISACWMSDIGSRDHPEFRGEQAYYRVLRQPGIGLNHHARAFLALTLAVRYDAEIDAPFLATARALLDVATIQRAERLGVALRLAYTVCAGTAGLLASTSITLQPGRLCLRCIASPGDGVVRRLERLGALLGLEPALEEVS